jgi:hypothetical protein
MKRQFYGLYKLVHCCDFMPFYTTPALNCFVDSREEG